MNKATLAFLLNFTEWDKPIQGQFFSEKPKICLDELLKEKYLEQTTWRPDEIFVQVDGESHRVFESESNGRVRYWYVDEDETVDVEEGWVKFYTLNYTPLAQKIYYEFNARNHVATIIPNSLWLCGNQGRQQRELYLTLNAGTNANIRQWLEEYAPKRAIIFQIGNYDHKLVSKFGEQKVWNLSHLFFINEDKLFIDQDSVFARVEEMLENQGKPLPKSRPMYAKDKDLVEERFLAYFRILLENARRIRNKIPPLQLEGRNRIPRSQEDAASLLKISPTMMSRIKMIWEKEIAIHPHYEAYLSLMDFFFKHKFDSNTVFSFYDDNKSFLREAGFVDDH